MSELYEYNPGQISEEELAMIKLEDVEVKRTYVNIVYVVNGLSI